MGDVQESSHLSLAYVHLGGAGSQTHDRELVVVQGTLLVVVLEQAPDQVVSVELPGVHAHGVKGHSVERRPHDRAFELASVSVINRVIYIQWRLSYVAIFNKLKPTSRASRQSPVPTAWRSI